MTVEAKKHELAGYRIKQAEESLDEARFLLAGKKSPAETFIAAVKDHLHKTRKTTH